MVVTREDAENLLNEISGEFLRKVQGETPKPSKIRYFDEHQVVEVKFDLWHRYVNRRKHEVSYMWTIYLRTQRIRYGLAVSCSSADASERALIKLLGEDTIKSLKERGLSIIRLDRRVMLGKEMSLDAFGEAQKEESLNLMLGVHSFLANNISTFEESSCFDGGNDSLVQALKEMKTRYEMEWENNGKPLIDKAREEVIKFAKGESDELNLPSKGDAGRLLWFVAGGVSDRGDPDRLREFLRALIGTSPENAIQLVREYSHKIKGTSMLGIINLATLVYPEDLMPLWGSARDPRGILNPHSSKLLRISKSASALKPEEYAELLKRVRDASRRAGISDLWETAFYLLKMGYNKDTELSRGIEEIDQLVQSLNSYLASKGYLYPEHLVAQFYTALKTKGFVILSGLTGTGKTKIAQELAELLDPSKENPLFLPVRPDWRDSKALLGYYNPLTGEYQRTKLLDFILKAIEDYKNNGANAKPYFLLLDEMNLAHVEYYFADFLSVLESGRDDGGFTREPLRLHDSDEIVQKQRIPKELYLPPNLYIIGTVNMDETTYAFSPKVLDRAFVVEFHDVDLEGYPPAGESSSGNFESLRNAVLADLKGPNGKFLARQKEDINSVVGEFKEKYGDYWKLLKRLNKALEPYDLHFGYRVVDEIALFFRSAKESQEKEIVEFESEDEIFDLALLMKVLPKFHGNRKRLEKPLREVLKLCLADGSQVNVSELRGREIVDIIRNWEEHNKNFRFKHTAKKVLRMLRQLYEIGFASFS